MGMLRPLMQYQTESEPRALEAIGCESRAENVTSHKLGGDLENGGVSLSVLIEQQRCFMTPSENPPSYADKVKLCSWRMRVQKYTVVADFHC